MKKLQKEYLVIAVIVLLFACVSFLSFTSIRQMQGNARVVNYVGIVRGATQKLVKKELMGYPDDALIDRLDSIVTELLTGVGPNNLIVLNDPDYLSNMRQVQAHWAEIKQEIRQVRDGASNQNLFNSSEDYFSLVDRTVSSAELFSERQVNSSLAMLIGVNGVFVLIFIVGLGYYIRTATLKKRADALGKIAYVDPLTQMPNRASCEQQTEQYTLNPPDAALAVLMFDMNSLKRVNDELGHQGGDQIIADFARIIRTEGANFGFVGRYGGDEFLAIFPDADEVKVQQYLTGVNEKILSYNLLHVNEVEKISFAVGYCIRKLSETSIIDMIDEADKRMYIRKRQMKENKD